MPSLKTHYFFATQLYNKDQSSLPFLKDNYDVVILSAQGPDPLMFYGYVPWRKRKQAKTIRDLASTLHKDKALILHKFKTFFSYANQQNETDRNILLAAIYGELTHYFLDSNLHPYVFYKTGYHETIDPVAYFFDHGRFESMIDSELERVYKIHIPSNKIVACDAKKVAIISKMYATCSPLLERTTYSQAVSDMKTIERLLLDDHNRKKRIMEMVGLSHHQAHALSHYRYKPKTDTIDYLNEQHTRWLFPDSGKESTSSILDLMDQAQKAFPAIYPLFKSSNNFSFETILGTINYDGIGYDQHYNYADSVYGKTRK